MTTLKFESGATLDLDGDQLVNGPREDEIADHFIAGRGLVTHFLLREVPGLRKQLSLRCVVHEIHRIDLDPANTYFKVRPMLCDREVVVEPDTLYFRYYVNRNKGELVEGIPAPKAPETEKKETGP